MLHKRLHAQGSSSNDEDEALFPRADGLSSAEYADILAKRVVFSRAHVACTSSILFAGVVEVLWILLPINSGVAQLPDHPLFTLVEGYVTAGLVSEIVLRAILEGRREFCQKWSNVLDVGVAAVSLFTALLWAAGLESDGEVLLTEIIVTARVVFRLLRLLSLSRGFRQHQASADSRKLEVRWDVDIGGGGDDGTVNNFVVGGAEDDEMV